MPTSCAAASAVTAATGVIRARRAGAKTHSFARSSRVENHRHRRLGVIARAGVPSENDSTREVAASSDAGRDSYPVFIFRLLGFMLPLLLIARAVYVFRQRREQAMINTVNDMFMRHHAQTSRVQPATGGTNNAARVPSTEQERRTRRFLEV